MLLSWLFAWEYFNMILVFMVVVYRGFHVLIKSMSFWLRGQNINKNIIRQIGLTAFTGGLGGYVHWRRGWGVCGPLPW